MLTETISIEVDAETAQYLKQSSQEDKKKLGILIGANVRHYAKADRRSLKTAMENLRRQAEANGLTPEILQSILEDE